MMRGEYYVLALTALLGIFVMVSANSLLTVYIGVELLSLSLYAMVAFDRESGMAAEVGDEVLRPRRHRIGHVAVWHVAHLRHHRHAQPRRPRREGGRRAEPGRHPRPGVHRGRDRVQVRRGAVPHVGAGRLQRRAHGRDAVPVDGAEDRVVRFRVPVAGAWHGQRRRDVAGHARAARGAVMVFGNVVAIAQTNLKRMLAYSAIGNVGFILLGFVAGTARRLRSARCITRWRT